MKISPQSEAAKYFNLTPGTYYIKVEGIGTAFRRKYQLWFRGRHRISPSSSKIAPK